MVAGAQSFAAAVAAAVTPTTVTPGREPAIAQVAYNAAQIVQAALAAESTVEAVMGTQRMYACDVSNIYIYIHIYIYIIASICVFASRLGHPWTYR